MQSIKVRAPIFIYPMLMLLAISAHTVMGNAGASLLVSTYLPVIGALLVVIFLERVLPERQVWQPNFSVVKTDLAFMLFVQIILPKILTFLLAITLLDVLKSNELVITNIWLHDSPIMLQVVMMVLIADFFRYWFHRASHDFGPLWRLHSVHHSPELLYSLNVGRFHPLEKALQFLFDTLPFIVLGVSEKVLALYFVFYAVNGFLQHCNIKLRYGWLNYLISGAELHRWHHSRKPDESGTNFGNNTIVWDILFGTRFLPEERQVGDLGLLDRDYPRGFIGQTIKPFTSKNDNGLTD